MRSVWKNCPAKSLHKVVSPWCFWRHQEIIQRRLREVSNGTSESRIVFARMMLLGMVTPAILLFLTSGVQSFSPKLPDCIAHRVVDMLTDAHPICAWPSVGAVA